MDAVANLREIYALLKYEQSAESQHRLVQKFVLQYARGTKSATNCRRCWGWRRSRRPDGDASEPGWKRNSRP